MRGAFCISPLFLMFNHLASLVLSLLVTANAMRLQNTPTTRPSTPIGEFNSLFHINTPEAPATVPARNPLRLINDTKDISSRSTHSSNRMVTVT